MCVRVRVCTCVFVVGMLHLLSMPCRKLADSVIIIISAGLLVHVYYFITLHIITDTNTIIKIYTI